VSEPAETCRVDVWLWRARFFKTRSLAARVVEEGGVRLSRGGGPTIALDKPSRTVRGGDILVFPCGTRWMAVKIVALGVRRGPAPEARALYGESGDFREVGGADLRPPLQRTSLKPD
jgi:ribosome-associated heat shock protein Hsp15